VTAVDSDMFCAEANEGISKQIVSTRNDPSIY
jgi:hypothetical protein